MRQLKKTIRMPMAAKMPKLRMESMELSQPEANPMMLVRLLIVMLRPLCWSVVAMQCSWSELSLAALS